MPMLRPGVTSKIGVTCILTLGLDGFDFAVYDQPKPVNPWLWLWRGSDQRMSNCPETEQIIDLTNHY
jgi:hypothetical protein